MIQSGGFLCRLLDPLLKTGLPLIKNVTKLLAQSVLTPLGLTAAGSAADAGIHEKKILRLSRSHSFSSALHNNTTTLIILNDEMKGIIEIVKSLEDSSLLLRGFSETIQNEAKEQNISQYVAWYIGCKFIRKYFSRKKNE